MSDHVLRMVNATLDEHVQALVEKNRDELIRAAEPDEYVRNELLELNRRIEALKERDPDVVRAWGLGCGDHCLLPTAAILFRPPRNDDASPGNA